MAGELQDRGFWPQPINKVYGRQAAAAIKFFSEKADKSIMQNESGRLQAIILDDDQSFLHMLRRILEERGLNVEALSDPDKAAAMILCQPFHLVFADCVLRASQGADFVKKIRSYVGPSIEAVMMSGVVNKESVSDFLIEERCLAFLQKPIIASDIDEILTAVRDKRASGGGKDSLLLKLFSGDLNLRQLKSLISLKKAKPADLLLIIAGLLKSREGVFVKFSAGRTSCAVFLQKGEITDCEISCAGSELSGALAKKNIVSPREAGRFEGKSLNQILIALTKECAISPYQETELKRGLFFETLRNIQAKEEIPLSINLFASPGNKRFRIDQRGFSEAVFQIFKGCRRESLAAMFSPEVMEKSLAFDNPGRQRFPEAEELGADLKEGMSLKDAHEKRKDDPDFYSRLLYILCRGRFAFEGGSSNFSYMTDRYRQLSRFFKTANAEEVFAAMGGAAGEESQAKDILAVKRLYSLFVKNNHPDIFPSEIPSDLKDLVNMVSFQIKQHYSDITSADSYGDSPERKEERIKKEIELERQKKACKFFLENKRYQDAADCLKSMSKEILEEDTAFQMLYLWLCFKHPKLGSQTKKKYYLRKINEQDMWLKGNSLYYYICGLYYEERGLANLASRSFKLSEKADPFFLPAAAAVRKYKLKDSKKKKSGNLLNKLSNIRKKKSGSLLNKLSNMQKKKTG